MIDFVTSISWIGWGLIVLAALTIWQLPAILRERFKGTSDERPLQPGENPPHLGPDGH